MPETDLSFRSNFMKLMKIKMRKCLCPGLGCASSAIRSHSIQNATALELIQSSGKVVMFKSRMEGEDLIQKLQLVGRSEASIFTGFCKHHDTELFLPIERHPLNHENKEHLFLLAFRATTRELHAQLEGSVQLDVLYQSVIEEGGADPRHLMSLEARRNAHRTQVQKLMDYRRFHFDMFMATKTFSDLEYNNFILKHDNPTVAVSSNYSNKTSLASDYYCISLSIIPLSRTQSLVSFCYGSEHAEQARKALTPVLTTHGYSQKLELSKTVISNIENFALSPRYFKNWTEKKLNTIEGAFRDTMHLQLDIGNDEDFMLFE